MNLKNKTVALTGCSSGIGAETARQLKEQGARVIGFDLKEPSGNVDQYIPIDLANESSIQEAVAKCEEKIDALCNIAGVPPTLPAMVQIKVNFFGLRTFTNLMCLNNFRLLEKTGGRRRQNICNSRWLFF